MPRQKPNVLFIAIDDLRDWVGYLGAQRADQDAEHRPARRAWASRFTRSYCAAPVCNPSRAALMCGLRPSTTGVYDNNNDWRTVIPRGQAADHHVPQGRLLRLRRGQDLPRAPTTRRSEWDDYLENEGGGMPEGSRRRKSDGVGGIKFAPLDCEDDDLPDYKITDYGIEQLGKTHDKPFFLAVGLHKPHMPWNVPQKYYDMFPLDEIELPPYSKDDLADIPPAGVKMAQARGRPRAMVESGRWKEAVQGYLAAIAYPDMNIGRLLDAFDKSPTGTTPSSVFWGDHGWHLGEKEHWRKFALWEEATRAPLIWVVPGVTKPGGVCERTVDFMSIYPTLCDLAGIPTPAHVEGTSIKPLLADPESRVGRSPRSRRIGYNNHAVRTEGWRYIRYANGDEELYDEANDPTNGPTSPRIRTRGRRRGTREVAAEGQPPRHRRQEAAKGRG